jgi:hypothetical protein
MSSVASLTAIIERCSGWPFQRKPEIVGEEPRVWIDWICLFVFLFVCVCVCCKIITVPATSTAEILRSADVKNYVAVRTTTLALCSLSFDTDMLWLWALRSSCFMQVHKVTLTFACRVASIKHVYWNVKRPLRHVTITSYMFRRLIRAILTENLCYPNRGICRVR